MSALDKASQKSLQDLNNFILRNMEEDSRRGEAGDWSYLRNLFQLADLRWQADVLGTYEAPGTVRTPTEAEKRANERKGDRNRPVSFVGQMMTNTWDTHKQAYTGCEFEPFNVWVLSLPDETAGSVNAVMLEELLEKYCQEIQPEGADGLVRTTMIWRLPVTLVLCLRRFRYDRGSPSRGKAGDGALKLETAVDVPMSLDFTCGSSEPVCHQGRMRKPDGGLVNEIRGGQRPGASQSEGPGQADAQDDVAVEELSYETARARRALGNACVHRTRVPSSNGKMWESPAAVECREFGGTYDLTGVCYHLGGSLESGHYVAAVKGKNNQWWECNDEHCTAVDAQDVPSGR